MLNQQVTASSGIRKFGDWKLHNDMCWLELEVMMVNDRQSLQKESGSREWKGIAVRGLSDEEHGAMIDDNYAHLIVALGELLATEMIGHV